MEVSYSIFVLDFPFKKIVNHCGNSLKIASKTLLQWRITAAAIEVARKDDLGPVS